MASEIQTAASTGQALYALLRNQAGQVYNTATPAFENYNATNYTNYATTLAEQGATGYYIGTMPPVSAGVYNLVIRLQVGGSPALSDPAIGAAELAWNGTAEVSLGSMLGSDGRVLVSANSHTAGETVAAVTAGVVVATNNDKTGYTASTVSDKTGYALTGGEHTAISGTDVPAGLVLGHLTTARADKLDNLDAAISSRLATSGYTAPDNADIVTALADLVTLVSHTDPTAALTAIKTVTDQLRFTVANQVDANTLTGGGGISLATPIPFSPLPTVGTVGEALAAMRSYGTGKEVATSTSEIQQLASDDSTVLATLTYTPSIKSPTSRTRRSGV